MDRKTERILEMLEQRFNLYGITVEKTEALLALDWFDQVHIRLVFKSYDGKPGYVAYRVIDSIPLSEYRYMAREFITSVLAYERSKKNKEDY